MRKRESGSSKERLRAEVALGAKDVERGLVVLCLSLTANHR